MIDTQYGKYIAGCDICGGEFQYAKEYAKRNELEHAMKEEGWQHKYENDECLHICPECRKLERKCR